MAKRPTPTDRITIHDVAARAGVSIATVSRVLNASAGVADETRARVLEAVEHYHYHPQRNARALAQPGAHTVAVAVPSATSLFYVELLKGVRDELRTADVDLLLCNLGSVRPFETLHRFLDRGAVDALLVASIPILGDLGSRLEGLRAPVSLVGTSFPGFDAVTWDDAEGAAAAVRHLLDQGHRRVGMIAPHPWSIKGAERQRGYVEALGAAGIAPDPDLVALGETRKHAGYSEEAGDEAMQKLLALSDPPTAVFAASDVQAIGALAALRHAGLRAPEDVALVGYDNIKLARYLDLTTVNQTMYDVGLQATRRLLDRLRGSRAPAHVEHLEPPLVVRGSSRQRADGPAG
ncbi:MAG: LacI family DNA-binding transcriptional regulator [Rubricoccaceae bacterium]|nr:LacI family DNA-binding transcriptional regulator [Rubricoccaceae bacterium]